MRFLPLLAFSATTICLLLPLRAEPDGGAPAGGFDKTTTSTAARKAPAGIGEAPVPPPLLPVSKRPAAELVKVLPKGALPETQKLDLLPRATSPLSAQLAGGFSGTSSGMLIVAGRAGDAAETSPLNVWSLPLDSANAAWQQSEIPAPAWAAAAQWREAVVIAGGLTGGKPTDRVTMISAAGGKLAAAELPKLPKPLAGAGAAIIGSRLFVFGGASSVSPAVFENAMWSLDLDAAGAAWTAADSLPGAGRAFAAVTQQYDSVCMFGGLVAGENGAPAAASAETWMFHPKPREATLRAGWMRMADMPSAAACAVAFPVGQAGVVVSDSGTAPESFPFPKTAAAPPLLFHTVTDSWCPFDKPFDFDAIQAASLTTKYDARWFVMGSKAGQVQLDEFKIVRTVRSLSWVDYLVVAAYFSFISLIGVIASRKQKSSADFSLGGRRVPWWVAGISMFATGASAISFMAIPALAFSTNLVFLFPILVYVIAYFVQAHLIFPLLRRMQLTSTYEYLERRFNKTLRLIASAQCILFQTFGRASVVLVLPSLALSATTGVSVYTCVIVMWLITTIYTLVGGFQAVVWTDVFQGILKFTAPLAMIALCIFTLPHGPREFVDVGMSHHKFDFALATWNPTVPAVWILLISTFLAGTIVQAGDQPVIQRVFSSPQEEVRRVAAMSAACGVLIATVVNVLGIAIFTYFHAHPARLDPLAQNDKIVPLFVIQALPHGFVGMVIAAIFASAMTTVASSMNSSATVFTEDFYMRFRPGASDKRRVRVLRIASAIVGIVALCVALLLATLNLKSLMVTWSIISALLGGGIVGVYSLGMFTRRANGFGAVGGAVVSVIVTALVQFKTSLHWQALIPIAILSCMGSGYLLSFLSSHQKDLTDLTIYTPSRDLDEGAARATAGSPAAVVAE